MSQPANRLPQVTHDSVLTNCMVGSVRFTPDGPLAAVGMRFSNATLSASSVLQSPAAVDEIIAALLRSRATVWPEAPLDKLRELLP